MSSQRGPKMALEGKEEEGRAGQTLEKVVR
jgi:hypothetical protein